MYSVTVGTCSLFWELILSTATPQLLKHATSGGIGGPILQLLTITVVGLITEDSRRKITKVHSLRLRHGSASSGEPGHLIRWTTAVTSRSSYEITTLSIYAIELTFTKVCQLATNK